MGVIEDEFNKIISKVFSVKMLTKIIKVIFKALGTAFKETYNFVIKEVPALNYLIIVGTIILIYPVLPLFTSTLTVLMLFVSSKNIIILYLLTVTAILLNYKKILKFIWKKIKSVLESIDPEEIIKLLINEVKKIF